MIRKLLATAAIVALLGLATPTTDALAATPKIGASCTKLNQQVVVKFIKLKCVKSGTKKVWKRIGSVPRPAPKPTITPTPSPTAPILFDQSGSPASVCKLPQASYRDDVQSGWPRNPARILPIGNINYAMLFVDFASAPAVQATEAVYGIISPMSENEFTEQSSGRLNLKYLPHSKWLRLNGDPKSYDLRTFFGHRQLIADAIAAADAEYDFSKVDGVVVMTDPRTTPLVNGPALTARPGMGIWADGKEILNGTNSGADLRYWGYRWANHEISHNFGLPDLYAYNSNTQLSAHRFVGDFSYMGLINGTAPGLTGWERWSLNWLTDDQMLCEPKVGQKFRLSAVANNTGTRMAVLKLGGTRAIALEYRIQTGMDARMGQAGVLAYSVDTSIASGDGTIQVIPEQVASHSTAATALYEVGDEISFGGRTFKIISMDATSAGIELVK